MRPIAQRLIIEEWRPDNPSDSAGRAAFRVCEKLRRPLSTLAGVAGFRSLLSRALTLAKADAPWLAGLQIDAEGTLTFSAELEAQLDGSEAASAGKALIARLLGLLGIFIGEALTLRLLHDVWPKSALENSESGGNQP